VGGYTVDASRLTVGTSTTTVDPVVGTALPVIDNLELSLCYIAGETTDAFTVHMFGGKLWTNSNGDEPDFFLFEAGGNDNPDFAAILPGGVLGRTVTIPATDSLWGGIGAGYNGTNDQEIHGVSFAITDLLDASGNPLTNSSIIEGLAITNRNGLDTGAWCAVASTPILTAINPSPADSARFSDTWANLGWLPGDTAASHDVYFSDNFDDVNDRTAEAFRGNQPGAFLVVGFPGFAFPDGLVSGTTYYWRVDEVEADGTTIHKGNVWSFWIPPRKAYEPDPVDGAKFADPDADLNWTAGFNAKLHYVYFGDNFNDVNDGVVGLPLGDTTYDPGPLELEKTYYWRVDEFDAITTHKGDVWSFKTLPDIPITDPNLVGWWKLDEGQGTLAVDWSGYGNHGTVNGDPKWVDGQLGGAMEFDGAGDFVDCGTDSILHFSFTGTVIAWIKLDAWTTVEQTLVGKGGSHWAIRREEGSDRILWYCNEADTG